MKKSTCISLTSFQAVHSLLFYCSLLVGVFLAPLEWLALKESTLDYYTTRCELIYNPLSSYCLLTLKVVNMCSESCLRPSRPCRTTSIAGAPDVKDIIADNKDAGMYLLIQLSCLVTRSLCLVTSKARFTIIWHWNRKRYLYECHRKKYFFTSQIISQTLKFSKIWLVGSAGINYSSVTLTFATLLLCWHQHHIV